MKSFILLVITFISIIYCLRFGYIWTAYAHGGQIAGIPFAFVQLVLLAIFILLKREPWKQIVFVLACCLFLSLAGFSVTIELIRNLKTEYFEFLYDHKDGQVNSILITWILIGLVATFLISYFNNRR